MTPPEPTIFEGHILERTCHSSQCLSQPAAVLPGVLGCLSNMDCHLFLIIQLSTPPCIFYLNCCSSPLGSKKIGSLISLLWAVAEDNECCTLEERLQSHYSKIPSLSPGGKALKIPHSPQAQCPTLPVAGHHQPQSELIRLLQNNLFRTCKDICLGFLHGALLTLSFVYYYRILPSTMTSVPAAPARQTWAA